MNTKYLLLLNDPPYGTERNYNALRLARKLLEEGDTDVRMFLIGDASASAKAGQKVPHGYYNLADMLGGVIRRKGEVAVCGTCIDARGITDTELIPNARRGSMELLTEWTTWADKVLVF
jgi:uncharacterized protein involved in oxidation of intracellular sulfur